MLTRELTFFCRLGLTITQAKHLSRLAGLFKSHIQLINVTRRQRVVATSQLSLLTLATQPGDLCLLLIEGLDAELAHMAFTCWCVELGQPLGRPGSAAPAEQRLGLAQLGHAAASLDKSLALRVLIDLLPAELVRDRPALEQAIAKREQIAATIIRPGLAMPHVICPAIRQPALSLLSCAEPIEWGSALGPVRTIILLAIPAGLAPEQLRPLTRLARAMMDEVVSTALLHASSAPARQAIVIEGLLS
ncbi:PTS sugar transporter subunit IIA [Aeromonas salmonicida subsp. achromogenes]|uniref:PTS sugar transporter subunit IIA n=1 Tax=Aeromonas salmonicida TaxID=645 RepID=UPI00110FB959|nr:PTS sugar transporter subunit IIA [Aeromonas salmonicida]TMX06271.1 PTS sugar transporter subunit IIA [Aeromonas salmonicida subsp. achromogenes]TMX07798.1 PTS sugar transporter subunit IIA [Aeromonas salmonicida subsp. achromogenes]TMX07809.1 PTS sugar transporter subunit IIA [Aeromonas salmonicida subsp. achromogenes]TMX16244.1 PTS sugar transporter subunit IIA [Aeromonas salmonicida subsp. achromogenes]